MEQRNVVRCNRCDVNNCRRTDTIEDASKCSSFLALDDFKHPILAHLLADPHKINGLISVLSFANLKIREIGRYPFFKLEVRR